MRACVCAHVCERTNPWNRKHLKAASLRASRPRPARPSQSQQVPRIRGGSWEQVARARLLVAAGPAAACAAAPAPRSRLVLLVLLVLVSGPGRPPEGHALAGASSGRPSTACSTAVGIHFPLSLAFQELHFALLPQPHPRENTSSRGLRRLSGSRPRAAGRPCSTSAGGETWRRARRAPPSFPPGARTRPARSPSSRRSPGGEAEGAPPSATAARWACGAPRPGGCNDKGR